MVDSADLRRSETRAGHATCSEWGRSSPLLSPPRSSFELVTVPKGGLGSPGGEDRGNEDEKVHRRPDRLGLRQAEAGTPVGEICRAVGVTELRELRQLREENLKLKEIGRASCRERE